MNDLDGVLEEEEIEQTSYNSDDLVDAPIALDGAIEEGLEVVPSTESVETRPPIPRGDPAPRRSGTISSVQEPYTQAKYGIAEGAHIIGTQLEDVWDPVDVLFDPKRVVDLVKPYANFGIASGEWLADTMIDATSSVISSITDEEYDESKVDFGRIEGTWGEYPERQTKEYKAIQKDRKLRVENLERYKDYYNRTYGTEPILTELLAYVPDILVTSAGGVNNVPKAAAFIESILGGAHAEREGTDIGQGRLEGALGGFAATKTMQVFMNKLRPDELAAIQNISNVPELKEDHVALLRYMEANPDVDLKLMMNGTTGNPTLDNMIVNMREKLGEKSYSEYVKATKSISQKAKMSIEETANLFSKDSGEVYRKMKGNADKAWDDLATKLDSSETVSGKQLDVAIDVALKDAPSVIKSFAKRIRDVGDYDMSLDTLNKKLRTLKDSLDADLVGADEAGAKQLKAKFASDRNDIQSEKALLQESALNSRENLSPQAIIELIKKITNKKDLAGGNINTHDQVQLKALQDLKSVFEDALGSIPGSKKFQSAYDQARNASSDVFNIFGYAKSGSNKGQKVFTPELGLVLDKVKPEQIKIVDGLIGEKPAVFNAKLNNMKNYISEDTMKSLKQAYIEKRLHRSMVNLVPSDRKGRNLVPRVEAEKFKEAISPLLDTADGRKLIVEQYSQDTLDALTMVRRLNDLIMNSKSLDRVQDNRGLKAFVKDLPMVVSTILGGKVGNYNYVVRMLRGHGEKVERDLADLAIEHLATKYLAGAGIGAVVAPEGYEVEGMALGVAAGKYGSFMKLFLGSNGGKKIASKIAAKAKTSGASMLDRIKDAK